MYDNSPNFQLTGSPMAGLPSTLDQINPQYYDQIKQFINLHGGRLASVYGCCLYDTLRINAGVLPLRNFTFFQNSVGQNQSLFVTTTTQYKKSEIDVSPEVDSGKLSSGYEALIWSIGVQFHTVSSLDETVQTSGDAINLTNDPGTIVGQATTDPIRQANLLRALQEATFFKLFLNNTGFENGPGWRFPSGTYGIGGGIALGGVSAAPISDGSLSNGFGFQYQFPVMRYIPELTKFGVTMSVQNAVDLTNVGPVRVVVTLEGIMIQPVTG